MTLPNNFYALPQSVNGNKENTLLNRAVKRRIADLKSIPKNNKDKKRKYDLYPNLRNIVIDTIFDETQILAGYDPKSATYRKKKSRYIDIIKAILDDLKKQGEIKGYDILDQNGQKVSQYKTGVSVRAIKIIL